MVYQQQYPVGSVMAPSTQTSQGATRRATTQPQLDSLRPVQGDNSFACPRPTPNLAPMGYQAIYQEETRSTFSNDPEESRYKAAHTRGNRPPLPSPLSWVNPSSLELGQHRGTPAPPTSRADSRLEGRMPFQIQKDTTPAPHTANLHQYPEGSLMAHPEQTDLEAPRRVTSRLMESQPQPDSLRSFRSDKSLSSTGPTCHQAPANYRSTHQREASQSRTRAPPQDWTSNPYRIQRQQVAPQSFSQPISRDRTVPDNIAEVFIPQDINPMSSNRSRNTRINNQVHSETYRTDEATPGGAISFPESTGQQEVPRSNYQPGSRAVHLKMRPREYDGKERWEDYIQHFERIAEVNGWAESDKKRYLCVSLHSSVERCLREIEGEGKHPSYSEVIACLAQSYGTQHLATAYQAELRAKKRREGQSVQDFAREIKLLVNLAYPGTSVATKETLSLDAFLDTLDPETKINLVVNRKVTRLQDAVQLAAELEAFRQAEPAQESRQNGKHRTGRRRDRARPRTFEKDIRGAATCSAKPASKRATDRT